MLVQNSVYRNTYLTDGINKDFYFSFPILESSQVLVQTSLLTDTNTVTTVDPGQYTVIGVGQATGGHISFTTAPPTGSRLALTLNIPITQVYQYAELDSFPAKSHEDALAKLTLICQQLKEQISRAFTLPPTSSESPEDVMQGVYAARDEAQVAQREAHAAAQIAIGNASASPVLATNTTVARTLADRFYDTVNVKDFGAVGDGVQDDTEAIQKAVDASQVGGSVNFGNGETYRVSSTIISEKPGKLNLNGSTIVADSSLVGGLLYVGKQLASYTAGTDYTAFSCVADSTTITLATGITAPSAGDLIVFKSNTVRVSATPGDYKHGMEAKVVSVSGQVIEISTPFYAAFQIDSIELWRGWNSLIICNGKLDKTNNPASIENNTYCATVKGTNIHIFNIECHGNDYASVGLNIEGNGALVENCYAYNFTQGTTGSRLGYGISVTASNSTISNCKTYQCKHGLVSASRSTVSVNVTYSNCCVFDDSSENLNGGAIDIHCNVINAEILDCNVVSHYRLLSLRSPATVRGGTYRQTASGSLIEGFEGPYTNLYFENVTFSMFDANSRLILISSASDDAVTGFHSVRFVNCRNTSGYGRWVESTKSTVEISAIDITIEGCAHSGGSLIRLHNATIHGLYVKNNNILSLYEGAITIRGVGGVDTLANVYITGNIFRRTSYVGAEDMIEILSSNFPTRLVCSKVKIGNNEIYHDGDTGGGSTLELHYLQVTDLCINDNTIIRDVDAGTNGWRGIAIQSPVFTRWRLLNNMSDSKFNIFDTTASSLTDCTIMGNTADSYEEKYTAGGMTISNRLADNTYSNNFATFKIAP